MEYRLRHPREKVLLRVFARIKVGPLGKETELKCCGIIDIFV